VSRNNSSILRCAIIVAFLACVVLPAVIADGQDTSPSRVYDEQLRVDLDKQAADKRNATLSGGGWFSFAMFKYDDQNAAGGGTFRTLRQSELRLWGGAQIGDAHKFYVRAMTGYDDWNAGTSPLPYRGDNYREPKIERAWYELDVANLLAHMTGNKQDFGMKLTVGRQLMDIGTGLALSMPLDAVAADVEFGQWQVNTFIGKSIANMYNPVDTSADLNGQHRRCMWGLELAYNGLDNHRPFIYYLDNKDHSHPRPRDANQKYGYSSRYVGLGSEGILCLDNLEYRAEMVWQTGKTYSDGSISGRDEICAWAADVQLAYYFQKPTKPKVWFEYIYASGDNDRDSVNTTSGNRAGTKDHAFGAFGFRDTGIALAPRISNIHIFQLGGSFVPFEKTKLFKQMEIGSKVFFYQRAAASGAISDPIISSTNGSRWLGWEWDIYCDWRITSDLSLTVRYGVFQPGAAYDSRNDCRHFLYTALTYSF